MRMAIQKTGPYGFGLMYHVIHLSEDVHAINDWYERVFDADVWMGRVTRTGRRSRTATPRCST